MTYVVLATSMGYIKNIYLFEWLLSYLPTWVVRFIWTAALIRSDPVSRFWTSLASWKEMLIIYNHCKYLRLFDSSKKRFRIFFVETFFCFSVFLILKVSFRNDILDFARNIELLNLLTDMLTTLTRLRS